MHPRLAALHRHGQSIWLDTIDRRLLGEGGLARLIEQGVTGVTTNPAIFQKAIAGSADYDDSIRRWLAAHPHGDTCELLDQLMIEDVIAAADLLRGVHERSGGADGYVSLEVSPRLAHDAEGTLAAARRLFAAVDRPNVMIKIPATVAGIDAIEAALADGININVTLLFSVPRYLRVLQAHQAALERLQPPGRIAAVMSFFVSRIDTAIDARLQALGSDEALALRGRVAIACATRAWHDFIDHLSTPRFAELQVRGARVPRLLFGSTGTKNPAYPDTVYVDRLIGRHTVNTVPPATLEAFLDHGHAEATLEAQRDEAEHTLAGVQRLGIDIEAIAATLEAEGLALFVDAYDSLVDTLHGRRQAIAA